MSANTNPIQIGDFVLAIKELSDEILQSTLTQLNNSISKLEEGNEILTEEIGVIKVAVSLLKPEESHEEFKQDLVLYTETIEENKGVIANQRERVAELNKELEARGLKAKTITQSEHQADEKEIYL